MLKIQYIEFNEFPYYYLLRLLTAMINWCFKLGFRYRLSISVKFQNVPLYLCSQILHFESPAVDRISIYNFASPFIQCVKPGILSDVYGPTAIFPARQPADLMWLTCQSPAQNSSIMLGLPVVYHHLLSCPQFSPLRPSSFGATVDLIQGIITKTSKCQITIPRGDGIFQHIDKLDADTEGLLCNFLCIISLVMTPSDSILSRHLRILNTYIKIE